MKEHKFRNSFASLLGSIIGILLFIFPIYKRVTEDRDPLFIFLYLLTILYFLLDIAFKIIKPRVLFRNECIEFRKNIFYKKKILNSQIIEIKWSNSDVQIITKKGSTKIDSKDIHKKDRPLFIQLLNEIKPTTKLSPKQSP